MPRSERRGKSGAGIERREPPRREPDPDLDRLAGLRGGRRASVFVGAAALIFLGLSRIYLGVHYPSDVLGGFAIGGAWVALCLTVIRAIEHRGRIYF